MSDSEVILYSYYRSSASWRVRTALALKNIKYVYKAIDLIKDGGQQHTAEYAALNPMEQVPCLIIDGATLTQSLPILEYIEETRRDQGPSLYPSDPVQRAQTRALAEIINSGTQPLQSLPVVDRVASLGLDKNAWARFWITKGLTGYEKIACQTAGKFSVGDQVSIADICLVPQVHNALSRHNMNLTEFPTVSRIVEACRDVDAFNVAHPSAQPDFAENLL